MSRRWVDTLPEVNITDLDVTGVVVTDLGLAMQYLSDGQEAYALHSVRRAAAFVRAWRKSLPEQEDRLEPSYALDRGLVRDAIRAVLAADSTSASFTSAIELRFAEASLRALGKRLMERVEPEPEPVECPDVAPAIEAMAEAADQFATALGTYLRGL